MTVSSLCRAPSPLFSLICSYGTPVMSDQYECACICGGGVCLTRKGGLGERRSHLLSRQHKER